MQAVHGTAMQRLQDRLWKCGLDVSHVFPVERFLAVLAGAGLSPAALSGSTSPSEDVCALLVGNTRHLWKTLQTCCQSPSSSSSSLSSTEAAVANEWRLARLADHPLDTYVEETLRHALADVGDAFTDTVYWLAHRRYPVQSLTACQGTAMAFVPFQRLAQESGLAPLLKLAGVCLHPTVGPWFALRAACLLRLPRSSPTPTGADLFQRTTFTVACQLGDLLSANQLDEVTWRCQAILDRPNKTWRDWVELRCVVHEYRPDWSQAMYGPDQLAYHYTHDPRYLPAA